MTVKIERRTARLALSALAALTIAACSDNSSPTGASPLPSVANRHQTNLTADANVDTTAPTAEPNEGVERFKPAGGFTCADFGETRIRVFERDNDVVVQYAIDDVPVDGGYYWIRFWPEGRNDSAPIDHLIGTLAKGESASGEFVAMSFDDIDRKIVINYNVDVDVAFSREDYENGETAGQCDRGGELCIEPPPEPPVCGARELSIDGMKIERIDYGNVRLFAYASASNFEGSVELEWQNMGHTELVATAQLQAECKSASVVLSWETDRSWARHATFIVRIRDQKGNVVDSATYTVGALKNGRPDTWVIS